MMNPGRGVCRVPGGEPHDSSCQLDQAEMFGIWENLHPPQIDCANAFVFLPKIEI